jgi:GNAT superfamily N-acetyltransferase
MSVRIEDWEPDHPDWPAVLALAEDLGQTRWLTTSEAHHLRSHVLVASDGVQVVGLLRFVIQQIGPELDRPPVTLDGVPLTEAKVLAFGVAGDQRRRGIGRALQVALIERARAHGCWQVRSHSSGANAANHQLKLSLGYGVHPIVRGDDTGGAYFVLPLSR